MPGPDRELTPFYVQPAILWHPWPLIVERIEEACQHGGGKYDAQHIYEQCMQGAMQLWLVIDKGEEDAAESIRCVVVTEIGVHKLMKVARVVLVTGEHREDWQGMLELLEQWARDHGCRLFEPICRPGWEPLLRLHGYRKVHIVMRKDLTHG